MKTRLSLLLIPILFLVTACSKSTVNPNQTILTTVSANKWSSSDGGRTWVTFISMPEIDSYNNAYSAILVYGSLDGSKTFEQLPEVFQGRAYSFAHKVGQVELDVQASDGFSAISAPSSMDVKIVIVQSSL